MVSRPTTALTIAPDQWSRAVEQAWRARSVRLTAPRLRILHVIAAYDRPFTAEQLLADLQQRTPTPGRATVYRLLDSLHSDGWLVRLHQQTADMGYHRSFPGHVHHLICTVCGQVVPFEGCLLDSTLESLRAQTNFLIQGHALELYGVCARCQAVA